MGQSFGGQGGGYGQQGVLVLSLIITMITSFKWIQIYN